MKWSLRPLLSVYLLSLGVAPLGAAVTNWVAFNDHTPGAQTAVNATRYNMRGVAGGNAGAILAGNLTNFDTGAQLPVVITSSATGSPDDFGAMGYPTAGTPAYELFNGKVDLGNNQSGIGVRSSSGSTATITFSNLDPSKRYVLFGTSVRGGNYLDRWTLCTIMGADSFNDAHTAGVATSANFPGGGLTAGQAAYNSGHNLNGEMVGWTDIEPGADGQFSVVSQQFVANPLPNGAAPNLTAYGYGICAVMLAEVDPSGVVTPVSITADPVPSLTVAQNAPFTLSAMAAGTGPLSYHWFRDGNLVSGAISPTLSVLAAALADAGSYRLEVSNSFSRATSMVAVVTVNPDTNAPVFLRAVDHPTLLDQFSLTVNEPLNDVEAIDAANWQIGTTDGSESLGVANVAANGTNLTFQTVFPRDPAKRYRIGFPPGVQVSDRYGNYMPLNSSIDVASTYLFQQNLNGYTGTRDTELRGAAPDAPQGAATGVTVDLDDGGGISHGLLRFDDLFGSGPGQVPVGAQIVSATLVIQHNVANANGTPVHLHRMLRTWDAATDTYNSLGAGVQADDTEARSVIDAVVNSAGLTVPFTLNIDVTPTAQAWANGEPNHGWAFLPTGTDGYRWDSSESATPPALSIAFTVPPCSPLNILTQPAASTTVNEGAPLVLSVTVSSPGCPARFQWVRNGMDIPDATNSVYTVPAASSIHAGTYTVRLTNDAPSSATSASAVVMVTLDNTRPVLTRAISPNDTTVVLTFSKALAAASAEATANYVFTPPVAVTSAVLSNGANNGTVTLTTGSRTFPGTYNLRISNVTDNRSLLNPVNPNPTYVDLTAVTVVEGYASAPWQYATNSQDGQNWTAPGFVPGPEWLTGPAFFGSEDSAAITNALPVQPNPIATPLAPNNDAGAPDRFVTAYFRRAVTLPALPANTTFALCHWADDGAIFYLDGAEIGRFNMPVGPATFVTRATAAGEASLQCLLFSAPAGAHTLAVEVHQGGATTSSDVLFGAEIRAITLPPALSISRDGGGNVVLQWTADGAWQLTSAPDVTGPYTAVAGNPAGSYTVAPAAQLNHQFFRLHYLGNP